MHKIIILTLLVIGFTACTNSNESLVVETEVTFSTALNPSKSDWHLSEVYKDTLEFIEFDDSYDYSYAVFKTLKGNSVFFVFDDIIDAKYSHGIFAIEWKIDSLYETGKGKDLYYDERLLSYTIIEQPVYFGDFLTEFIQAYSNDSSFAIQPFLNDDIGFHTTVRSGLYCIINEKEKPDTKAFIDVNYRVLDEKLVGDPCDGFPNIEDGLYFESIKHDEMPSFESPIGEVMSEFTFPLKQDLHTNRLKKVVIITNEYQYVQLYFVNLNGGWYLWAEDFCNC
jgi:hypothetical protein